MPVFTAAGRAKTGRLLKALDASLKVAIDREAATGRNLAADLAPSPTDEAEMLSTGVANDGLASGRLVGTPAGNRFIRGLGTAEISLREAIRTAPVITEAADGIVRSRTCSATRINLLTGFSWETRSRGIQGPTYPFNRAYVQALENGGAFWLVVPQTDRLLNPEPGVVTGMMTKTLPPIGMFRRAKAARREPGRVAVKATVRVALKEASGAPQ